MKLDTRRVSIRHRQRGQALIYGIFVVISGLAALFFLFNTGQLSQEKTKLVNTADAVAYSAGVMHARALNFSAYGNRALAANELLVAQMVSLSSWARYAQTHTDNLPAQFPTCALAPGTGEAEKAASFLYGPEYAAMCHMTVQFAGPYIQQMARAVPSLAKATVTAVEINKQAIRQAHDLLHAPLYLQQIRAAVMQDVAQANYADDGSVQVEPAGAGAAAALTDDWGSFTRKYSGQDRGRIAELTRFAAHTDPFMRERKWDATAVSPDPSQPACFFSWRKNEVRRRGGTELVNFDEWIAQDTESFWHAQQRRWFRCRYREEPIAYGEQQVHPEGQDQNDSGLGSNAPHSGLAVSRATNGQASSLAAASSSHWTNYSGLPGYYDLAREQLDKDDPRLTFSVRLVRARGDLRTSDGSSQITTSPGSRINAYESQVAGGAMAAVASAEVYFERPFAQRQNSYGAARNRSREIGSLFNPYWQVRLVHSEVDVRRQQQRQGVQMP